MFIPALRNSVMMPREFVAGPIVQMMDVLRGRELVVVTSKLDAHSR